MSQQLPVFEHMNTIYESASKAQITFDHALDAYMSLQVLKALSDDQRRVVYNDISSWFDIAFEDYTENKRQPNSVYRMTHEYPGLCITAIITML